ncbi:MAG: rhodanese-like domain-containing protein [Bacteroidetes bacterium]|nr:rhodanese-like domain-containing protein [Bacteroidota bacterium]MBL6944181.1 rhodanese-like domain-containing protein [Bacteroidales bacterium]
MHVHELNPKKTLIAMLIFAVVIIAGLLTINNPRLKYQISPAQAISMVSDNNQGVDASKIDNLLSASTNPTILIDIRNHYKFARGHIASANNISGVELLSEENIKWLNELNNDKIAVIIYGDDPLQTNGPWMVLQQLGFENIKFLKGGYNHYVQVKNAEKDHKPIPTFIAGKAKYNYAEVAKISSVSDTDTGQSDKKHSIIRHKKKGTVTAGGC